MLPVLCLLILIPFPSVAVLTQPRHRPNPIVMSSQAQTCQRIYNARATKYDQTFHAIHAPQYVQWAGLRPGHHVLDVACGTGLVSLPAARAVRPTGSVTGVDVADGMLAVARQKAALQGLPVTWIQHDVTRLDELALRPGGYDAITAASCVPLFADPGAVVKHWARFLAPGGRLAFDTLNERSYLPGLIYERVAQELGRPMAFPRGWIRGRGSVEALIHNAGLKLERSFTTDGYGVAKTFHVDQAPALFDEVNTSAFGGTLNEPEVRDKAKHLFVKKFRDLAGSDGLVKEKEGFYTIVGRRL